MTTKTSIIKAHSIKMDPCFKSFVAQSSPQLLKKLNTLDEYSQIRSLLVNFGLEKFIMFEKSSGTFIFCYEKLNIPRNNEYSFPIKKPYLPFTFFYTMETPDGPNQKVIPTTLRTKYAIVLNRVNFGGTGPDSIWDEAKNNPLASMSMYHQFIVIKNKNSLLFNALTFGMGNQNIEDTIQMLKELRLIAELWANKKKIPKKNLGCFFHIYPNNSVQSLHLHILDTRPEHLGAAWYVNKNKNMPLSVVLDYFENKLIH